MKRRRQLEALARNNPRIDIDALLARHEVTDPTTTASSRTAAAPPKPTPAPVGEDAEPSAGLLVEFRAVSADVADQDGDLTLVFWAEDADEEHPTLGVPTTEAAALRLLTALDVILAIEDPAEGRFEVSSLRLRDVDRKRNPDGTVYGRVGRTEMLLTDSDGREILISINPQAGRQIGEWFKPGLWAAVEAELEMTKEPEQAQVDD